MNDDLLTPEEVAAARTRRLVAQHLEIIEGNPLTDEEIAMFEMFDRERWSHARCLEYILSRAQRHGQRAVPGDG